MKNRIVSLFLLLSVILAATSFAGCKGEEQITATTKDIPVYNEEATNLSGNEKNVEQPVKENTPDMSKYIEKEYVEANYVRKDEVQTMIDEAVGKATIKPQKSKNGNDGRGIASMTINGSGDLCVVYTDGTIANVGHVRGDKGDRGDSGPQGEKGDPGRDGKIIVVSSKPKSGEESKSEGQTAEEAEEKARRDAEKQAAEELAAQQAAAAAAAATSTSGLTPINCKDGTVYLTPAQIGTVHATWDYAGDALEMATHHSIAELEAVVGATQH